MEKNLKALVDKLETRHTLLRDEWILFNSVGRTPAFRLCFSKSAGCPPTFLWKRCLYQGTH